MGSTSSVTVLTITLVSQELFLLPFHKKEFHGMWHPPFWLPEPILFCSMKRWAAATPGSLTTNHARLSTQDLEAQQVVGQLQEEFPGHGKKLGKIDASVISGNLCAAPVMMGHMSGQR